MPARVVNLARGDVVYACVVNFARCDVV
jgi:hypothetical protein